MERIRVAVQKARELQPARPVAAPVPTEPSPDGSVVSAGIARIAPPVIRLDPAHMEASRLVSYQRQHPSHFAFDMLRTKISQAMAEHGWTSLGITSPAPGCGKTVVALNLAFSVAQQSDTRVALVDLDLRNPRMADTLGRKPDPGASSVQKPLRFPLGQKSPQSRFMKYFCGELDLRDFFCRVGDNLFLCLNDAKVGNAAEWMRHEKVTSLQKRIREMLGADIVIFDLPPANMSDDVLMFSPFLDCALAVSAAGETTAKQIEECERQLTLTNYVGIVLNKSRETRAKDYGYY